MNAGQLECPVKEAAAMMGKSREDGFNRQTCRQDLHPCLTPDARKPSRLQLLYEHMHTQLWMVVLVSCIAATLAMGSHP